MPASNGITVKDVQDIQKLFAGGITSWEYEVLMACRNVMSHGNGSFQFKVNDGRWTVSETTRAKSGKI